MVDPAQVERLWSMSRQTPGRWIPCDFSDDGEDVIRKVSLLATEHFFIVAQPYTLVWRIGGVEVSTWIGCLYERRIKLAHRRRVVAEECLKETGRRPNRRLLRRALASERNDDDWKWRDIAERGRRGLCDL
jgi:hypothetical protein